MTDSTDGLGRRNFLKALGAAGLYPMLAASEAAAADDPAAKEGEKAGAQVPKRKLGKRDTEVCCLGVGGGLGIPKIADVLAKALEWGITYWDTSISYSDTELGIGKYLSEHAGLREKIFIVTKTADISTPLPVIATVEREFQQSLKRLKTDYIDLYLGVHALGDAKQLTDDLREWAEKTKKKGLIKHFGFSTHSNMARNLAAAAKLDWIDAILTRCDFRLLQEADMKAGVDACHKAGIGLIAIKAMSAGIQPNNEQDKKLAGHFLEKGFTAHQAKLKALLEDKRFTAVAVGMREVPTVDSCAAAVLDKVKLGQADKAALNQYAQATGDSFCAGCQHICGAALPDDLPMVSDIMRYLMYHNSCGQRDLARRLFARIPADARKRLLTTDYSLAEASCPQRIPIATMVAEAMRKLA